jgi:hypothetical protein
MQCVPILARAPPQLTQSHSDSRGKCEVRTISAQQRLALNWPVSCSSGNYLKLQEAIAGTDRFRADAKVMQRCRCAS